jgi:hypothetical protein
MIVLPRLKATDEMCYDNIHKFYEKKKRTWNQKNFRLLLCKPQINHGRIRLLGRSFQFSGHTQDVKLLYGYLLKKKKNDNLMG